MRLSCPIDPEHTSFVGRAVVEQEWLVDEHGNPIEVLGEYAVITDPKSFSYWVCYTCDVEASKQ